MDKDWMNQTNETAAGGKKTKGRGYRNLANQISDRDVKQAKSGKKWKRQQVSQTVHLSPDIADEVKTAVDQLADEWSVPKNDVWQFVILLGLQAVEDGAEPSFRRVKKSIVLPDVEGG